MVGYNRLVKSMLMQMDVLHIISKQAIQSRQVQSPINLLMFERKQELNGPGHELAQPCSYSCG